MYRYSKKDLDRIASETGFIRDNLEKVFRLCEALQYLNENPLLAEHLALKGGTAINLTVFNLPRLSVDIDLDFTKECSPDEMLEIRERINRDITNYMFTKDYKLSPGTKSPHSLDSFVFYFQNAVGNKDNIKIEINYSMRHHILPIVKRKILGTFLPIDCEVRSLAILELFGSKIKALIERTASRDLYDVHKMLQQSIFNGDEQDMLRKIVLFYLSVGGSQNPTTTFDFAQLNRLMFPQIRSSLIPVLKKSERFDFETAKIELKAYLSCLMTLSEDEKLYVEFFNQGIYHPELLFDEQDIIKRIKYHPMALWKMKHLTKI